MNESHFESRISKEEIELILSILVSREKDDVNRLIFNKMPMLLDKISWPEAIKLIAEIYQKKLESLRYDEFKDKEITDWKRVRSAIEHENQLVNHRLTWLLNSQGFLFAAFGAIYVHGVQIIYDCLVLATIAIIGISICFRVLIEIIEADNQLQELDDWWHRSYAPDVYQPNSAIPEPRKAANKKLRERHPSIQKRSEKPFWHYAYLRIELVFIAAWLYLIFGVILKLMEGMIPKIKLDDADGWYLVLFLIAGFCIIAGSRRVAASINEKSSFTVDD